MANKSTGKKIANQYDNDNYNYRDYWHGRDYENDSEEMAIKRLLKGKHFGKIVDIGGGFGRLCVLLQDYGDNVTLAEPSKVNLKLAEDFLKDYPKIERKLMQADDLKFNDGSIDLLTMIRVMHHIPEPEKEFSELHRVLAKDGRVVLEVANYSHFRNRVKHIAKGKPMPEKPIDIRSEKHRNESEIAFVNHNPKTIIKQLDKAGFEVERVLSVSNLRSPTLKKIIPKAIMLSVEKVMQPTFALSYFGPSVFFLLKKK